MQALYRKRRPLVARLLEERPWCERCSKAPDFDGVNEVGPYGMNRSTEIHEKLTRARGGDILDEDNCVALCQECHNFIHSNIAKATEEGWLIRRADARRVC